MAQQNIDLTANENLSVALSKIQSNFTELYAADSSNTNWSGTTVTATGLISGGSLQIDTGTKTATATAGAATLNKDSGKITTESLTTAKGASYTLTLTNSAVAAADMVFASVAFGTATTGDPVITRITPAAGSVVIVIQNIDQNDAVNGTLKISFLVAKA